MDLSRPTYLHIYLPNGEVDILNDCTDVAFTDGTLWFTDRVGQMTRTSLPFIMMWSKEASRTALLDPGHTDT